MLKQSYHIQEEIIEWRRDIHAHPELGFKEFRTSAKVADELEKLGYRVRRNVGRTGVVADFGNDNGPVHCHPRRHGCTAHSRSERCSL